MTATQLQDAALDLRAAARQLEIAATYTAGGAVISAAAAINLAGECFDRAGAILFPAPVGTCDCHAGGVCRLCGRGITVALPAPTDDLVPIEQTATYRREYGLE